MSEKIMGRERCKDKGTSRTVHTEFQKPGAHLQASVFAPKERLTARSAPKDGPGRETLDQENIYISLATFLENTKSGKSKHKNIETVNSRIDGLLFVFIFVFAPPQGPKTSCDVLNYTQTQSYKDAIDDSHISFILWHVPDKRYATR